MSERKQILIESEDAFKTFVKAYGGSYTTRSLDRTIERCDVRGPFEVRKRIGIRLYDQTIGFENTEFHDRIEFDSRKNSKVIFDGCVFHRYMSFDKIQVEFSNCKFDFSGEDYLKHISFYYGSHATMRDCEFIGLQTDFEPSYQLNSGSIHCHTPTKLNFVNCRFQNCKHILDLNENEDNVLFEQCVFEKSSFFTSDEKTDVKNTRVRVNHCTFEESELTVLKVKEDCCLGWTGEDVYETSATFIVDMHSLPLIGSE